LRTALSPRYLIRMRSQVQVLAGPPLFSQLRALPPSGRSHPLPAWAAPGPHALLAVTLKALSEQATQRPSHGRPHAGDHVPHGLRAAIAAGGRTSPRTRLPTDERSLRNRLLLVGQAVEPGRWPRPLYDHGQADASVGPARPRPALSVRLRLGRRPAGRGYRAGDHADSGRPRRVAARRIGALDELTRFGQQTRERCDSGRRMPRCPDAQLDTGRRTPTPDRGHPDAWTPGRRTPVAWTPQAWTLDAHAGHWTPDAAEDRTG
jgi:hypothetical protein